MNQKQATTTQKQAKEKKNHSRLNKISWKKKYIKRAAVETGRIHFHTQKLFFFFLFISSSTRLNSIFFFILLKLMNRNNIEKKYINTHVYIFYATHGSCVYVSKKKKFLSFFIWREVKTKFWDNLLMLFKHLELL